MGASSGTRLFATTPELDLVVCGDPTASGEPCLGYPGFDCTPSSQRPNKDWRQGAFRPYLVDGGAGRLYGFWECCCQAIFAYVGTELIGIAADETERQRETLPKSVRRVSYRIIFYYVGAVFVLGLNVSANDPVLKANVDDPTRSYSSPFVLMVQRAGIPGLAHVINAVALIAALSVANANLYVTSRTLYALAREGQAPRIFEMKNRYDVPSAALAVSALPAALAFLSLHVTSNNVNLDGNGSDVRYLISCQS